MTAYLVADVDVNDSNGYEEYKKGVPATIAAHGGRYLARGGSLRYSKAIGYLSVS